MKSPTDLFDLIKSMTKSEKRYFKLYASKHVKGTGNCVRLFDAIDGQESYDETDIRRRFRKERFVRQLPVQKNYLYDLILRSLRAFHSARTVEMRIKEMLHDVEVLFSKGLYDQCSELLARCRQAGARDESYDLLLATLSWEIRLAYSQSNVERLHELAEERERILRVQSNLAEYFRISLTLLELERANGWLRDARAREALEAIMRHPLMANEAGALSFKAKTIYFNSWNVACALNGDRDSSYAYARRYLELLESHADFIRLNQRSYITALSNAASAAFRVRRYDEMHELLHRLEVFPTDSSELRARILGSVYHHTLNTHVVTGNFEAGAEQIERMRTTLESYRDHIATPARKVITYMMAYVQFGAGNHAASLELLQDILNEGRNDTRQDIQKAARILSLIIHHELGNTDLVPYVVRSTYRLLSNRDQLDRVDRTILSLLRKLPSIVSGADLMRAFVAAREELTAASASPDEYRLLRYIDLDAWLTSKIERRTFGEIVRARHAQQEKYAANAA
ncbi:MAG TPA: hypothetical protein VNA88_04340 [Candidatus Kapabacteria bacterium]|jgi:hypothetical protein|nr:hypothetical protein [Candidatus Kapabacteria bacterium]